MSSLLKKLFLKEEFLEKETTTPTQEKKETVKFPLTNSNNMVFNNTTTKTPETHILPNNTPLTQACEQHMDKLIDVYQKAFDNLNMDGYDFYEFMDGILTADETGKNPLAYTMQYSMISKMDKTLTKEKLAGQADYYEVELKKAYDKFVLDGKTKKEKLLNDKVTENSTLTSDLDLLNQQLESLKIQILDKQTKLSNIDNKYLPQLNEVDCKLIANDAAKDKIISTIELIKNGILTNIK